MYVTRGFIRRALILLFCVQPALGFDLHWDVAPIGPEAIDTTGIAFKRDVYTFYEHTSGLFPGITWPHVPLYTDSALAAHLAEWRKDIEARVPPQSFGYGVIDLEAWQPVCDRWYRSGKYWVDTLGKSPDEYNAAARKLMDSTIQVAKRTRPNLKWGFWDCPQRRWWADFKDSNYVTYYNREIAGLEWLWKLQTAYYPSIYCRMYTTASPATPKDWLPSQHETWLREMIENHKKARDIGRIGAEILPYMWSQYESTGLYDSIPVNSTDWRQCLQTAMDESANGLVLWGYYPKADYWRDLLVTNWNTTYRPITFELLGNTSINGFPYPQNAMEGIRIFVRPGALAIGNFTAHAVCVNMYDICGRRIQTQSARQNSITQFHPGQRSAGVYIMAARNARTARLLKAVKIGNCAQ